MTFGKLRLVLAGAAAAAAAAVATLGACSHPHAARHEPFEPARTLGESTASPGDDPSRPIAQSSHPQEVSAQITARPAGPAPAHTTGPDRAPAGPAPAPAAAAATAPPAAAPPPVAAPPAPPR